MKQFIGFMGDLLLLLFAVLLLLDVLSLEEQLGAAQSFYASAVERITVSQGNELEACRQEGGLRGYTVTAAVLPSREGTTLLRLELTYGLSFLNGTPVKPFTGRIEGYVRY